MKVIQKRRPINVSEFNFNMDDDMQPGLYDIPIDAYHTSEGLSNSGVSKILDCPYKYWYEYMNPNKPTDEKESRALVVGQALHTKALEPEKFEDKYWVDNLVIEPIKKHALLKDLQAEHGKEQGRIMFDAAKLEYECLKQDQDAFIASFHAHNEGKIMLTQKEFDQIQGMADSIRSNKAFMKLVGDKNKYIEHSVYFNEPETGVLMKSRPDFFNHFLAMDIKTTISAKQPDFEKTIFNYGYHRQAALGLDALTALTGCQYDNWVILAVEKEAPYLTALYVLDQASIELGRRQYKEAARLFKQCVDTNRWEGYSDQVVSITLPTWAFNNQSN